MILQCQTIPNPHRRDQSAALLWSGQIMRENLPHLIDDTTVSDYP